LAILRPSLSGAKNIINANKIKNKYTVTRSLKLKKGWNAVLSALPVVPTGLEDPLMCKYSRWPAAKAAKMNGNVKWSEKNLFIVAEFTEKPPHTNSTNDFPNQGIALKRLVITVAQLINIYSVIIS